MPRPHSCACEMLIKMCTATCSVLRDCWLAFIYIIFCCQLFFREFCAATFPQCSNYFDIFFCFSSLPGYLLNAQSFLRKLFEQTVTKWQCGCWWWWHERMALVVLSVGIGHFWRGRKHIGHFWHFLDVIKWVGEHIFAHLKKNIQH